ncbi:MAG: M3 family metallopeptidase [Pseudomonadota bacterium]
MPDGSNPFLFESGLPPFLSLDAEPAVAAVEQRIAEARDAVAAALSATTPSWSEVVQPIELARERLSRTWSPIGHLHAVADSEAWRSVYKTCLPKLSEFHTEFGQNEDLYRAYQHIADGPEFATLSVAKQQVITNELREFRLAGVHLEDDAKSEFAALSKSLSELSAKFSENVLDATQSWTLHITDEARLKGLPEASRALLQENASRVEKTGWVVTLDFPSYHAVMSYAEDRLLREEVYRAYVTRASELSESADNRPLIDEILKQRHRQAQILGFESFATLSVERKMAPSVDAVFGFLRELARRARPTAEREFRVLADFAKHSDGLDAMNAWDIGFYSERLRQREHAISQEALRPYFPLDRCLEGLFAIVKRLYRIDITERRDVETWHEDIRFFELRDAGQLRGQFYLDAFARHGKRGGAWMDECRTRRPLSDEVPVAYLTCNFTPPLAGKPALLTHDELTTLFHEFGHGFHHMATRIDIPSVSGINGVAWDAVELPSQFFEYWCWDAEGLTLLSRHIESGESLPSAEIDKLRGARNFQVGMQTVRQLEFGLLDFHLHHDYDPDTPADLNEVAQIVRDQVAVVHPPSWNRFANGFTHIFAGGYAAGYYSYKWAEVLAADAFSQFEESGVFDSATGERFLNAILEQGGAEDAMTQFVRFRGREPTIDALLRLSGLEDAEVTAA